jgi:hypothetical protein
MTKSCKILLVEILFIFIFVDKKNALHAGRPRTEEACNPQKRSSSTSEHKNFYFFSPFFVGHLLKTRAVLLLKLKNPSDDSQIPSFSLEKNYCRLRGAYLYCVSIVYRYRIIVTEILSN